MLSKLICVEADDGASIQLDMKLLLFLVTTCSAALFQASINCKRFNQQANRYFNFDDSCIGNITIGTPPQSASVFMDTTSANWWVIGSKCTSANCNGYSGIRKHKFNTTKSTSFVEGNRTFSTEYGLCTGYLGTDTVQMGGLTITKQELGIATIVGLGFGLKPYVGIFELAWPALSVDQVTPPMQKLISQNQLDAPMFTIWLDQKDQGVYVGYTGLITYGGFDNKNCDANVTYVALSSKTFWQ